MANVKPGDLARVIADPEKQNTLGLVCVVTGPPDRGWWKEAAEKVAKRYNCLVWVCQSLEERKLHGGRFSLKAGEYFVSADCVLKRIDPPADWKTLWHDQPLDHEEAWGLTPLGRLELETRKEKVK